VEVLLVVVPLITERLEIDDDALMLIPRVVVGVSAPEVICQSRKELLMKSTPAIAVETAPAVALRSPESDEASLVSPVTARFVVVALVVVALVIVTPWKVDEAPLMMRPRVVVGDSAPETISKVLPNAEYPAGA